MQKALFLYLFLFLNSSIVFAALPKKDWVKVDHPSVDAFYTSTTGKNYLTVVKNQAREKMNFDGQSEADIAHVLTLLRRVSLTPFGITDWTIASLKKSKYKNYVVIQIQGTYLNRAKRKVSFSERMYFLNHKFTQFSWIQPDGGQTQWSTIGPVFNTLASEYL